jgi:NhaP-type Na+/H+ or K+/H+ antiporter
MVMVLIFAATLLAAVLVSGLAQRSVLSTAILFLLVGFVMGRGVLLLAPIKPGDPLIDQLATLALFSVLFTDGMRANLRDLSSAWRLPGRALFLGLPLTLILTGLLARLLLGLPWAEGFLLGAVLSPTDPVFAAAIVGRDEVPIQLRRLLNVESGLNDGLALPVVLVLLNVIGGTQVQVDATLTELALGVGLGIVVPWILLRFERIELFSPATAYEPLNAFGLGMLIFALGSLLNANLFLAAFVAGITIATLGPEVRDAFHGFGESITELLKLSALLVFGALISTRFIGTHIQWTGYLFAFLVLVAVRPLALGVALRGSGIGWPVWIAAAWFGPKGFASMIYGFLFLKAGVPQGDYLFHIVAVLIAWSIIAHSSTDVLVARWFRKANQRSREGPAATPKQGGNFQAAVDAKASIE